MAPWLRHGDMGRGRFSVRGRSAQDVAFSGERDGARRLAIKIGNISSNLTAPVTRIYIYIYIIFIIYIYIHTYIRRHTHTVMPCIYVYTHTMECVSITKHMPSNFHMDRKIVLGPI